MLGTQPKRGGHGGPPLQSPQHAFWARRYDEALEKYRKASEINARFGAMEVERELLYEQMGRLDDWAATRGKQFDAETREAYRTQGLKGYWTKEYRRALKTPQRNNLHSYWHAELFARMGDKDRAFEHLAYAMNMRDHRMTQLKVNPILDPLCSDPRFDELLRQMKLTP